MESASPTQEHQGAQREQVRGERLEQVAVVKLDLVGHAMLLGIVAGRSKSVIMATHLWRSSRERCVLVIATKHAFWR